MSYQIDHAHSQIQFTVRHMMISKVRGWFEKFNGTVHLDEQNPVNTTVEIEIDAASINTREEKRDGHLRSADFLNAENYPALTFKSKNVDLLGSDRAQLTGDLTIRGITREVVLDVEYSGSAKSPWGTTSFGFNSRTVINRKDWDLTWNAALETGGMLVGDEITIDIELELVQVPEKVEVAQKAVA
jgi:polyisoprenoid-binding protein YceI